MNNNYNNIFVEIIQDKLGTYFANVNQNGYSISGIAKNVDYKTLKESIREKTNGFIILKRKYLIWQKFVGRKTAYIQNYKNDDVSREEGVDCRMVLLNGKLEHYKREVNSYGR